MTADELRVAWEFGKQVVEDYNRDGQPVPRQIVNKLIEIAEAIMKGEDK